VANSSLPSDETAGRLRSKGGRSPLGLVQLPERRVTIWALVVAVFVAAACWYLGVDVWHSVLLGGVLTTVGLLSFVGLPERDIGTTEWRDGPGTNREGARGEVADLSWSLRTSYGRVDIKAVSRVRQLARRRLALHHLDLNDPADRPRVELLIGPSAYGILVRSQRRPRLRSLLHCLDALDAMDAPGPTMPTAPRSNQRRRGPHRRNNSSEESP
jgi:hypothetical protein